MAQSTCYFDLKEIKNLTTNENILSPHAESSAIIIEFDADSICIDALPKSCNIGQLVKVEGTLVTASAQIHFTAVAKVEKIEFSSEKTMFVSLKYLQYNKEQWSLYTQSMKQRQTHIDQLFLLLKDEV